MINIEQMKLKDRNDLIESLKLSVDLLKANYDPNIDTTPSSKSQVDQDTGQQNTSDELERISKELREASDRILDKNAVIENLQAQKAKEIGLNQMVSWQLEKCKSQIKHLEETKKEMMETIAELTAKPEEKDSQLSKKIQHLEWLEEKVDCIEKELIEKNATLQEKESELKSFQTANEQIKENSSKLVHEIKEKNNELEKCRKNVLELESKIENLAKELIQKNTALDNYKSLVTDSQTAIEKLKDISSKLVTEIKEKDIDLIKSIEYLRTLKSKVDSMKEELIQKNLIVKNNESQITVSTAAVEKLKDINSKLSSEIKEMENKLRSDKLKFDVEMNFFRSKDDWIIVGIQKSSSSEELNTLSTYHNGFSTPNGNYWIGLERLHRLTWHSSCELHIQFDDGRVLKCYNFVVGSKEDEYRLKRVGWWTGDNTVYMRKYEGGSFRIFNSKKLGWWLPEV